MARQQAEHRSIYSRSAIHKVTVAYVFLHTFIPHLCPLFSHCDLGQALGNVCYCDITFLVR